MATRCHIDALKGSGQFNDDDGYGVNNYLTIGVNNGSGTWSGQISDQSNTIFVIKTGSGTETFSGSNVYHGTTTINGGVLALANSNAVENSTVVVNVNNGLALATSSTYNVGGLSGSGNISLTAAGSGGAILSVGGNEQSTTYSGVLSGLGSLIKAGTGTLVLSGSETYTGGTTISGGTLQLGDGVSYNGSIAGSATDNATLAFANPNAQTYTGTISGSGNVTMLGPGTLALTASNTYSGGTTVGGGTLQLGNAAALGSTSGAATISSGVLDLHGYNVGMGALSGAGTIDNLSGSGTYTLTVGKGNASGTFSGVIQNTTGAIALSKTGTGTLVLSGSDTYTGGTTISSGTLQLGDGTNHNGSVAGSISDNAHLTFANPYAQTYTGTISGSGSVVKTAAGTQVLTGSNTYTGSTTINGGNLAVNGSLSTSSSVTVTSPGVLSGTGRVGGVTVNSLGTVAPGFGGNGTLTASSLSLAASSVLSYTLGSGTATDSRLSISGSLTLRTALTLTVTPASSWGNGTYVLATYGSLTNNSSSFSGWTVGGSSPMLGRHTYGFSVGSGSLDLSVGSAAVVNGTWSGSGGGSWGTAGDWQGGNIPRLVGDTATFGTAIGSTAATVTLDGARGLSGLTLSTTGGGSYTLSCSGGDTASTLVLANGGSTVPVSVSGGSQTITVPVTFFDNVSVSAASGEA